MLLGGMRMYVVTFAGTITNAGGDNDLFSILPGTGRGCIIVSCKITVTSELADAADEALDVRIKRGATTQGSVGNAATAYPLDEGNGITATATCRTLDTTIASGGTEVEIDAHAPPQRNEYRYQPIPAEFIRVENPSVLAFRLATAVADDVTGRGTLIFGELD